MIYAKLKVSTKIFLFWLLDLFWSKNQKRFLNKNDRKKKQEERSSKILSVIQATVAGYNILHFDFQAASDGL